MKCPFCNSLGLIAFTIGGPYITNEGNIDLNTIPKELKFFCNNCKGKSDPLDIVLKILYDNIGKINQALQIECIDMYTIANQSGLPIMPKITESLSKLKKRGHITILNGEVDKPNLQEVYSKITEAGRKLIEGSLIKKLL